MMNIKPNNTRLIPAVLCLCLLSAVSAVFSQAGMPGSNSSHPRIVNIVNFIRLLEPRIASITEDVLYQTVVKQVEIIKKYKLKGTFLLQYDALMDSRYQQLLKSLPADSFEIGAWWEIPQPMVEHAGLQWRGQYPWDWRANVGFSTGYTPEEREKLADVYMQDFKKIFGYYPKSVGSWFIDAHTLNYLYGKYHIVASSNCKDQIGTDGYTLWGGYWNQAYYPSKVNAYMPAQHEENQIPVPIFRMLGSDPVRQYDNGLGSDIQGVVTLEPVYRFGGGDSTWVDWYFRELVEGKSMAYAYTQAGQENSFTWRAMQKGFEIQMALISRLRDQQKIKVETLAESGQWFKDHFSVTPPTSVTVNEDVKGSNRKTVWFNSRFYRINLLWEDGHLRIRDIHLFNENLASVYETKKATTNDCSFYTLPVVDGFVWSSPDKIAGMRCKGLLNGKEILLEGGDPQVDDETPGHLKISWPLKSVNGTLLMDLDERQIKITLSPVNSPVWYFELAAGDKAPLPFKNIGPSRIDCQFDGLKYTLSLANGSFSKTGAESIFRMMPDKSGLTLSLSGEK